MEDVINIKNDSFVVNISAASVSIYFVLLKKSTLRFEKRNPNKTISSNVVVVVSRGIDFVLPNKAPL
jgi:hypothetical protein